jgi:ABC-type antimicrobial peptide transport system permease subunit
VIIITHDPEVARQCDRVIHFKDGRVSEITGSTKAPSAVPITFSRNVSPLTGYLRTALSLLPLALESLKQNRTRSLLTMLGIVIGVAAVLSMITVGTFTKKKILDSYAEMGVNTVVFSAYPNWELKATDAVTTVFQSLDWERDLTPLKRVFPQVASISPMMRGWDGKANFGGQVIDSDVSIMGISSDGLRISNRKLILGTGLSPYHVEFRSNVCVIGYEIYQRLFSQVAPIGQVLYVSQNDQSFGCRIVGVLSSQTSNKSWNKPNLQIFVPYTFFQAIGNPWESRIRNFAIQAKTGSDIEGLGKSIKSFFKSKYGKSMRFDVGSDSVLIAQMNKFLSLFTVLLGAIALVTLGVGGIGIANMMMVSVNERFKEIGIRKAFGATNFSIRVQYLVESVLICGMAGLVGLIVGFGLYETAIYGATKLVNKLEFEWVVDWVALLLSIVSILVVGILSGLSPAIKAEKLQVIESLRSE